MNTMSATVRFSKDLFPQINQIGHNQPAPETQTTIGRDRIVLKFASPNFHLQLVD
ncbi:hypothetical protein F511_47772 [Dorcoceras hygrometricum]|uniref:Uncharacterized protein n=1 Tax=Dorcoceras hygrometricum TaxID=472368 RepID=A0A2Z6ZWL5_9LAMI|nr:hypothetical protein F511_47772 [Dorcoceras hygrometricum]